MNTAPVAQAAHVASKRTDASTRWRKLLEDQRVSGLPISAFCRERGIAASSLFAWRRKLTRAGDGAWLAGGATFKPVTVVTQGKPRRRDDDDGADVQTPFLSPIPALPFRTDCVIDLSVRSREHPGLVVF